MSSLRSEFDVRDVETYLNSRLDRPTRLRSVTQTFPGMSRETWLALAEDPDEVGYILRIDPASGGSVPTPLRLEWEVYVRLWRSPIPTAEPLWYDEGTEFAGGQPHMVRRMVDGATSVPGVHDSGPDGEAVRRAVALEHAEKLAQVHSLDWKAHGLGEVLDPPPSTAESLLHQIAVWRGYWEKVQTEPRPLLTEVLYWFEEQLPPGGGRISLLKGNNGLGEEIWKDGRIVAMSDWELAELGEPALDWAFSQGILFLHDEAETLRHYESCAGFSLDPARLAWARVWILFKILVCGSCAIPAYAEGRDKRPALATLGLMVGRLEQLLGLIIGKDLEEAAAIVGRPVG